MLRALGLGDALVAVPALRALRRAYPGRPLLLAAAGPPADLLRAAGLVDGVVPTRGLDDAPPGLRLGPDGWAPHTAVNLHGRGPQSHELLRAGRPGDVLWFAPPGGTGPRWEENEHEADRWCRLVATTGAGAEPTDLLLPTGVLGSPADDGTVVVHPGANDPRRRWPADRWAAVAGALAAGGRPVVVTGGPDEAALTAAVVRGAGPAPVVDLAGGLTLPALVTLVAGAALVLSADTGVAHLATAAGTPSVVLFGPVPPSRWGPRRDTERHVVLWRGRQPGAAARPDGGLGLVEPAEVLAAAARLLAADAGPAGAGPG